MTKLIAIAMCVASIYCPKGQPAAQPRSVVSTGAGVEYYLHQCGADWDCRWGVLRIVGQSEA